MSKRTSSLPPLLILLLLVSSGAGPAAARPAAQGKQVPAAPGAEADRINARVLALAGEGKNEEALRLAEKVLELREGELGREHASVARARENVAALYQRLNEFEKAKPLYRRALEVYEKGDRDSQVRASVVLHNLALMESYIPNAISLHEKSLALKEKLFGPESHEVSVTLFPLAHLSELQGDEGKAERLFRRFVEIREGSKAGKPDDVGVAYFRLGCLMRKRGREGEGTAFEDRGHEVFRGVAQQRGELREDDTIKGRAIHKPQPAYPIEAKQNRQQGTVPVMVLVGESGAVLAACAGGKYKSLNRAAEYAAYGARFELTLVKGEPVKVRGLITYNFVLR
jgi:tetratricopeptide (TPR) repeat protein